MDSWTLSMPAPFYTSANMMVRRVTVAPEKSLIVSVTMTNLPAALYALVSEGSKPSLENHTIETHEIGSIQPAEVNNSTNGTALERYFLFPASQRTGGNTVYYVAFAAGDLAGYRDNNIVKSVDNPPDGSIVNVSFSVSIFAAGCLYWSEANETWQSDGCEVL